MEKSKSFEKKQSAKPSENKIATKKKNAYYIDGTSSMIILDLKEYDPKNITSIGYKLVVIKNSPNFGRTIQFEKILKERKIFLKRSKKFPKITELD